jgi:hypothetical protein
MIFLAECAAGQLARGMHAIHVTLENPQFLEAFAASG